MEGHVTLSCLQPSYKTRANGEYGKLPFHQAPFKSTGHKVKHSFKQLETSVLSFAIPQTGKGSQHSNEG